MGVWRKKMRILSMSGFVPEHICDTLRFTQYSGDRNISHYCGYASDFISQVLTDDSIDGAVYPKSCDSSRIITSYLQDSGKFLFQINVPSFGTVGGVEHFASEIRQYKESVEKYYKISIDDIEKRSEKINSRNAAIKVSYDALSDLSYTDYISSIHRLLGLPLEEQNWKPGIKRKKTTDKTVFIVGSTMANIAIVDSIERAGLSIIGDNFPESGRLVTRPYIRFSGDIYSEIAHSLLSERISPTQNRFEKIIKRDIEEIKEKEIRGVIFVVQKYCEPYEFLYAAYKSALDESGIKSLRIPVNNTEDSSKADLALEAFSDVL